MSQAALSFLHMLGLSGKLTHYIGGFSKVIITHVCPNLHQLQQLDVEFVLTMVQPVNPQ